MTEQYLNDLLIKLGNLFDNDDVTVYEAQGPREEISLMILQGRGLVRVYTTDTYMGLPSGISAELTEAGLERARELRGQP